MEAEPINKCPVPKGILVIIGGKEDKKETAKNEASEPMEVLKAYVSLINKENPLIEVITTASSDGNGLFKDYVKAFNKLGVKSVNQMHHNQRQDVLQDEHLINRIKKADAIFLTGGDQFKLTTIYGGTEMLLTLKQRYINERLVIGGTSAGAMAMSTPMIYSGNQDVQQISGEIKTSIGLEFLKDVCIDTHFVDRSRMVRMAQVVATNPSCIGIGIGENTALVVRNGVEAEVCGSGVALILNGEDITKTNILSFGTDTPISINGLKLDIVSKGSTFIIPQKNPPHI